MVRTTVFVSTDPTWPCTELEKWHLQDVHQNVTIITRDVCSCYSLQHCTERTNNCLLIIVPKTGICLSSPQLYQCRAVEFKYRNEILYDCRELWLQEWTGKAYTTIIFIATFGVPMFALTFLYTSIGIVSYRHRVPGNANCVTSSAHQNRIKVAINHSD